MSFRDSRWYPYFAGGMIFAFWLVATALPLDFPSFGQGLLFGGVGAALTTWTEGLRQQRRLRGQDEQDMGIDYRA